MSRIALYFLVILLGLALTLEFQRLIIKPWPPKYFASDEEHFKYGSIGAEVNGYPYLIWRELPSIFEDKLPGGYVDFGLITKSGHELPIGVSVRRYGVNRVGFNCATCHTSTYKIGEQSRVVYGAPANALDLQAYIRFLKEVSQDERLTVDAVINSAETNNRPIGWLNKLVLRYWVFPSLEKEIQGLQQSMAWMDNRAPHGPGRTDAGNFWRARWGLKPENDDKIGTVDYPSVWNQRVRLEGWFHWDGNNNSLDERNISAALAGGAAEWLLERQSIRRVSDWLLDLKPPKFPGSIDETLATKGKAIYESEGCGTCHDAASPQSGQVTSLIDLGTDRERRDIFSSQMVKYFSKVGELYSWHFQNYRSTNGYANAPLDGLWMRAPYLHNGSVPTLDALLSPVAQRPKEFFRGCTDFDQVKVGFVCNKGLKIDTTLKGNSNRGHEYGTALSDDDRSALIEYLKSF